MQRTLSFLLVILSACGPLEPVAATTLAGDNFALIAREDVELGYREVWTYDDEARLVAANEISWCRCSGPGFQENVLEVVYENGVVRTKRTRAAETFLTAVELNDDGEPVVIEATGPSGETSTTTYAYDGGGRLISIARDARFDEEVRRDDDGNVTLYLQDGQVVTRFFYDGEGRQVRREGNGDYDFVYDEVGRAIERRYTFAGTTSITTLAYDVEGRVVRKSSFDGSGRMITQERAIYDELGRLAVRIFTSDQREHTTTYAYDEEGRVLSKSSSGPTGSATVRYTYVETDEGDLEISATRENDGVAELVRVWTLRTLLQPATRPTAPSLLMPIVDAHIVDPMTFLDR